MQINIDAGESFGQWSLGCDETLFPLIDMANIACGFHASDPSTMDKTVKLAVANRVSIGAHPGFDDKIGFGRRLIPHTMDEIEHLIAYQVGALQAICRLNDVDLSYIKPHGALYNAMMKDLSIFEAVCRASSKLKLPLMILATVEHAIYQQVATKYQCKLIYEAFVDRNYDREGFLLPRSHEQAVIHSEKDVVKRLQSIKSNVIYSIDGRPLTMPIDTICIHGDSPNALNFVRTVRQWITKE